MESLYFIALVPPEDVRQELHGMKLECASLFNTKQALRSPPHITLHMPFRYKEKKIQELLEALNKVAERTKPLAIVLDGFDFFAPRVIFVKVVAQRALNTLEKAVKESMKRDLGIFNADYKNQPFHPHITIAFRDLKKTNFVEAKSFYESKNYNTSFLVEELALLKHDGKAWNIDQLFSFQTIAQ